MQLSSVMDKESSLYSNVHVLLLRRLLQLSQVFSTYHLIACCNSTEHSCLDDGAHSVRTLPESCPWAGSQQQNHIFNSSIVCSTTALAKAWAALTQRFSSGRALRNGIMNH
eukprot:g30328.t1